MAITSTFFDGPVTEVDHAQAIYYIGRSKYGVVGSGAFRVYAGTGDRTVNVAAGTAWGAGVLTTSTAVESVALPAPGIASRWYLIVLRRNWSGVGGTATITYIAGGSAKAMPASRNSNPGVIDDQPLALVRVVNGQSAVAEIVDMRTWGGNLIRDQLALEYVAGPGEEYRNDFTGEVWRADANVNWKKVAADDSGWVNGSFASGWGAGKSGENAYIRARKIALGDTYLVDVRAYIYRRGAEIKGTSTGNIQDQKMGRLPSGFYPRYSNVSLNSRNGGWNRGGTIDSDGYLYISSIPPNMNIPQWYGMGWQTTFLLN